jgi:ribosome-associated translation inhibitor RaiA
MQINIHTDSTIERHPGLDEHVQTVIKGAVDRFSEQITRVEVHLSDNKSQKSGDGDSRCLMEARVTGYQPIAVTEHAANLHMSIAGGAEKLKRALDSALGRLHDAHRHASKAGIDHVDEVNE